MRIHKGKGKIPQRTAQRLPELSSLHRRHPGLTPTICRYFAEAAAVCLSRHHAPPKDLDIETPRARTKRDIHWSPPTSRQLAASNNADDATRDGAYAVSLATTEVELELVAFERAETRTGADYYLSPKNDDDVDDLEAAYRLEVSGIDADDQSTMHRRLIDKVRQAKNGDSNLPAIAAVVGFGTASICIALILDDAQS